jgi:hypothetical protein
MEFDLRDADIRDEQEFAHIWKIGSEGEERGFKCLKRREELGRVKMRVVKMPC